MLPTDRNPLGLALTGVILIVIGLAVKALLPRLFEVGLFVVNVGYVAIAVAVIWFIILILTGRR